MQITKEPIGTTGMMIKIKLSPDDYRTKVDEALRKYQRSANIPGFRPGKVPVGMIKKMYGKSVFAEELNRLLQDSLYDYIVVNKIDTLGSPLPLAAEKEQELIEGNNFEFTYELGLAPQIKVDISEKDKLPYYVIKVDEEMVDMEISDLRRRYGTFSNPETSEEDNILYGDFAEIDEQGNIKENGNKTTTTLALEMLKDDDSKANFIGLKKESAVTFNPIKFFRDEHEVAAMLKVEKDSPALTSDYRFTVRTINKLVKADLNQDLFNKLYGENAVNSEGEFRTKIKEGIAAYFQRESDRKLKKDLKHYLLEKVSVPLPDDFLKRMLLANAGKDINEHDFEHQYYHLAEDLRWDIITNNLAEAYKVTVTQDDVNKVATEIARQQFAQYGMYDVPAERLKELADRYMKEEGRQRQVEKIILEDHIFAAAKPLITLQTSELPREAFLEKLKEKTAHEEEHHHH